MAGSVGKAKSKRRAGLADGFLGSSANEVATRNALSRRWPTYSCAGICSPAVATLVTILGLTYRANRGRPGSSSGHSGRRDPSPKIGCARCLTCGRAVEWEFCLQSKRLRA